MKRTLAGVVSVMVLVLTTAAPAQAQDKLRIGVLDVRKVVFESKPGQKHRAERDKLMQDKRAQLAKEEGVIRSMQEKLEKDKLVLTEKQREQKQQEIGEKIAAYQKLSQQAQQELTERDKQALTKVDAVLHGIVTEIAKQEKLSFVIDRNQPGVVWIDDPIDVTDKVLKAYEAKAGK